MKGHGYSKELLSECIKDAEAQGSKGLCILSAEGRKRESLADPKFLAYRGFSAADISDCGINLMYLPVKSDAQLRNSRMCEAPTALRKRICALLYRSMPVYILLGTEGASSTGA